MAENKTKPHGGDVSAFIASVEHPVRRADAEELLVMMTRASGETAVMWGDSLIGFGQYHYKYKSGHEGDFFLTGFSPRKANLSLYINPGFEPYGDALSRLGKHKLGRACLYITKLADVDMAVLEDMVADSVVRMRQMYSV